MSDVVSVTPMPKRCCASNPTHRGMRLPCLVPPFRPLERVSESIGTATTSEKSTYGQNWALSADLLEPRMFDEMSVTLTGSERVGLCDSHRQVVRTMLFWVWLGVWGGG